MFNLIKRENFSEVEAESVISRTLIIFEVKNQDESAIGTSREFG